jgi:hypothetical protein
MYKHKEAQEGHVTLNIGGYRFETSVHALRRLPHTFFDAYFSGRYAQDVCNDGSIFIDRDGEHFGHVLQYLRDGVISVAEPGAEPTMSLLRALKREFGFYCIDLSGEVVVEPEQPEMAYVVGGSGADGLILSNVERYDASSGQWSAMAAMSTARAGFAACVVDGDVYVTGGRSPVDHFLSSVEKYSPSSDTWSIVTSLPAEINGHAAVSVGSAMYVLGGYGGDVTTSVLKFDSMQGTWSREAPLPEARVACAASAVGNDLYVFGGFAGGRQAQASVFKFDTIANNWSILAPMPHFCAIHSACELNGLIYIIGAGMTHREVLRFNPAMGAGDAWSTLAPTAKNRRGCSSFTLRGFLYAAGGEDQESVERYDVATDTWTFVANMLENRRFFGAVTIGSEGPAEEQDFFDSLIDEAFDQ